MASTPENTGEGRSDLAVMDANEYKQKRRLERILDVVENVEEKADKAWDLFVQGDISHDAKNIMVQRAVQKAIREVYNLLVGHEQELADSHSEYWYGDPENAIGTIERDNDNSITITGLQEYMTLDTFITETVTERVNRANKPAKIVQHEREYTVPESVSWNAFLRLKQFLNEQHDLEIAFEEMDDELPTWGFEEVEEVPDDAEVL